MTQFCFETGSHYVAQASTLTWRSSYLSLPSSWVYRCATPMDQFFFGGRYLRLLGRRFTTSHVPTLMGQFLIVLILV
jgi:hypothetical protein